MSDQAVGCILRNSQEMKSDRHDNCNEEQHYKH
jgi:hypothetical protein